MRSSSRITAPLLALALLACEGRPTTQTLVRVSAERVTQRRTREVLVRVLNQAEPESPRLEQRVRMQGDDAEASFPLTVPLVPRGGDASIVYRVEVEAYDEEDRKFNEARVISGYVPDQLREVRVRLDDRCIDITCREDQTCEDGECIDAHVEPGVPMPDAPVAIAPLTGEATRSRRPELRWREVDLAVRYEVQLTDECVAGAIATCAFARATTVETREARYVPPADLAVSTEPPVGARWTWRVRACNEDQCSDWSRPRYVDVGRYGGDHDGDGYSDLLVGANGSGGSAWAYHGGPSGLSAEPSVGPLLPDTEPRDFGLAIAGADLDGDGYWDAVIGDFDASAVYVFRGSATGLETRPSQVLVAPEPSSSFGRSVALGDVDGDGLVDLVVGAYTASAGASAAGGALYVFEGGEDGELRVVPWLVVPSPMPQEGGLFGWSVEAVDLDGDGRDEIVGAAPDQSGSSPYAGVTWIFSSSASAPLAELRLPGMNEFLGRATARAGDLDGDGREDLLVGAPGVGTNVGAVYPVYGRGDASECMLGPTLAHPDPLDHAWFGVAVDGRGDVDGDGYDEIVVGAYRHAAGGRADEGKAYLFRLRGGTLADAEAVPLASGREEAGARFGSAVSIRGDYDGDGLADVVIGAADAANEGGGTRGAVMVFRGRREGISGTPDLRIDGPVGSADFGAALAR